MKNFNLANVIDLELTCYPGGVFPDGEVREIIEVGLCEVNLQNLTIQKTVSFPVKPTLSKVSPFCTELTGWTTEKLNKQGFSFAKVCELLARYGGQNRLIITDSDDELATFADQCKLMGVPNPLGNTQLNVSTLFGIMTRNPLEAAPNGSVGLNGMLQQLGMQFEGRQHRASEDAKNIARVAIKLLQAGRNGLAPQPE